MAFWGARLRYMSPCDEDFSDSAAGSDCGAVGKPSEYGMPCEKPHERAPNFSSFGVFVNDENHDAVGSHGAECTRCAEPGHEVRHRREKKN